MRKIFYILLCCFFLIPFTSCGNKTETQKIALTKENCTKYLNFNMYVTGYNNVTFQNDNSTYISCIVHVETSSKIECQFENVTITYSPNFSTVWQVRQGLGNQTLTTTDYHGKSHTTYCCITRNPSSLTGRLPNLKFSSDNIESIEGYVILQW